MKAASSRWPRLPPVACGSYWRQSSDRALTAWPAPLLGDRERHRRRTLANTTPTLSLRSSNAATVWSWGLLRGSASQTHSVSPPLSRDLALAAAIRPAPSQCTCLVNCSWISTRRELQLLWQGKLANSLPATTPFCVSPADEIQPKAQSAAQMANGYTKRAYR